MTMNEKLEYDAMAALLRAQYQTIAILVAMLRELNPDGVPPDSPIWQTLIDGRRLLDRIERRSKIASPTAQRGIS